jgi:hypothetical protein
VSARNPFLGPQGYGATSVTDRLAEVESFNGAELRAALKVPHLQSTVKRAIERRLDRVIDHHHNRKAKGKKS